MVFKSLIFYNYKISYYLEQATLSFNMKYIIENMKKMVVFIFLILVIGGCKSYSKFYNSGFVEIKNNVEKIELTFINELPFCQVEIGGKIFRFLVDTGAPTVISDEIFQSLKLKVSHTSLVTDSENKKRKQKYVLLPQIKIGNLVFKDIGSIVINFDNNELKCFGFDGIVGANLLAHLFCKFNYEEKKHITF